MKKLEFLTLLALLDIGLSLKVYDWQRNNGDDVTHEFAQVLDVDHHILHSAVDASVSSDVPTITFIDYNFTATKFEKGIMAIRPLLSDGNQLCFVTKLKSTWANALSTLQSRHKMTIDTDNVETGILRSRLPLNLDPLTVNTVSEFCGTERESIFFLLQKNDISSYNVSITLQTAFRRFEVGVADEDVPTVFALGCAVSVQLTRAGAFRYQKESV